MPVCCSPFSQPSEHSLPSDLRHAELVVLGNLLRKFGRVDPARQAITALDVTGFLPENLLLEFETPRLAVA